MKKIKNTEGISAETLRTKLEQELANKDLIEGIERVFDVIQIKIKFHTIFNIDAYVIFATIPVTPGDIEININNAIYGCSIENCEKALEKVIDKILNEYSLSMN